VQKSEKAEFGVRWRKRCACIKKRNKKKVQGEEKSQAKVGAKREQEEVGWGGIKKGRQRKRAARKAQQQR